MDPYRNIASVYDVILEPLNGGLRGLGMKMVVPGEGMRVLDVCCGTGIHLEMYSKRGCRVTGLDLSPSMIGVARKRRWENTDLVLADATSIPCKDTSFDLVLSMLALHEMDVSERSRVLSEIHRVVKQDGAIVLIDFHPGPALFLKGWFSATVIFIMEMFAGRRHFRNFRLFMREGGLEPLLRKTDLMIRKQKIVGGGTFALYLLTKKTGTAHG
jgi:ubiquinone/menaquinone biosynthesis C-methylase UbiE